MTGSTIAKFLATPILALSVIVASMSGFDTARRSRHQEETRRRRSSRRDSFHRRCPHRPRQQASPPLRSAINSISFDPSAGSQ